MKGMVVVGAVVALILIGAYWIEYGNPEPEKPKAEKPANPQEVYAGTDPGSGEPVRPRDACEALCREKLVGGADLSDGPCLSNEIAPGWVCDVAHDPRQDVDDKPENQCSAYGKTASHFVEVSPGCALIREV